MSLRLGTAPKLAKKRIHKIVIFRLKFRLKFDDDASKIWIRCAQNSLKKLEGAEVSMQLRGPSLSLIFEHGELMGLPIVKRAYQLSRKLIGSGFSLYQFSTITN
jgi:hypothetical protein